MRMKVKMSKIQHFASTERLWIWFSDTIAFHTVLTTYDTIPDESAVEFDLVLLNQGDGWIFHMYYLQLRKLFLQKELQRYPLFKNNNGLNKTKEDNLWIKNKYPSNLLLSFADTIARLEHSQCPLVEMDSTTSQCTLLFGIMSMLDLTCKSTEKPSAVLGVKQTHQHSLMWFKHHVVGLLSLLKVKHWQHFKDV